jgi:hypothetical protein
MVIKDEQDCSYVVLQSSGYLTIVSGVWLAWAGSIIMLKSSSISPATHNMSIKWENKPETGYWYKSGRKGSNGVFYKINTSNLMSSLAR